tara:strand:- start:212 stop:397 length:186 start_codon:yes stop_codon:yes gene_type:complete
MKNTLSQKTVENERRFYKEKLEINWPKEVELQYEIGSLEEKLKKARAKIRKLNKIIDALTK